MKSFITEKAKNVTKIVATKAISQERIPEVKTVALSLYNLGVLPKSSLWEQLFANAEAAGATATTGSDPFPDFRALPTEAVTKRSFNWATKQWETASLRVKVWPTQFAEGALRAAHFMVVVHGDGREERMVAKRQKDARSPPGPEVYDADVMMQSACQAVAAAFNARRPVKPVAFVDCFVIQRADKSWWAAETYIRGKYVKYNNNFGFVGKDARNTPQAFTHFSHQYTHGRLMIVDLQGVGDHYTDPQIHTADGRGFGQGNMGQEGMDKFLETHWCNSVCAYMGLKFHAPLKYGIARHSIKDTGTVAAGQSPVLDAMRVSDFVGPLNPAPKGAAPEDLALLGLTEAQFVKLAALFNELDTNHSGHLDREKLAPLLRRAKALPPASPEAREFLGVLSRLEGRLAERKGASFRTFVLCWTDNL